jgi:Ankyrin repeats (3 copies)/Ankyrin repeat
MRGKHCDGNYLMPNRKSPTRRNRPARIFGFLFFLVLLAAGLLLGAESRLTLRRDSAGDVTAVNAWAFAGRWALISHAVKHLREVKFQEMSLSGDERRLGVCRDGFGWSNTPEVMALVGDGSFTYPYHDDAGLIRGFLKNTRNAELVLTHPIDVRRKVASWVLLTVVALSVVGWIWKMVLGRDPLRGAERSVKPLPPALGGAVFVGGMALVLWFFLAGQTVFGPLATKKVKLLMDSAAQDNGEGIAQAAREGVFIDTRDGQSMTALMLAVRAGAAHAVDALLNAGANPNLRANDDDTALMMAIHMNHGPLALRLLDANVDIGISDSNGRTALHASAERADAAVLRLLLKGGADVNAPDNHGWTPLFFAAASGSGDAVRVLLDAGADPGRKLPDGRTAADLGSFAGELGERLRGVRQ